MHTIRERTNSFAALCNWIRELSSSINELSSTANTPATWQNNGIRELSNSIRDLSNWIRKSSNLRIIKIKELSYLIWEISYSIRELFNWVGQFSNSIKELSTFILCCGWNYSISIDSYNAKKKQAIVKLRLHYQSFLGQSPSKKTWSKFSRTRSTVYTINVLWATCTRNRWKMQKSSKYVNIMHQNFIYFSLV